MTANAFNMQMNIAKAIGITAIVAWHTNWRLCGDFFNEASWHVPLFFFISGYFFNINKNLILHIKNIIFRYFGWAYGYHFFYGAITVLIYLCFNRLYGKIPTLKTLMLSPIDSTPFEIVGPVWFLFQLAISLFFFAIIMYLFKKFSKNAYLPAIVFIPFGVIAVILAKPDFAASCGLMKVLIRTFISTFYIYSGWLYKNKLESLVKFNAKWLIGLFIIQAVFLLFCQKGYMIAIYAARIFHNISPFTTTFCGIYFVLFISKLLAPLVKENSLIDKIGKNSLHIMANHLFIIFLIQIIILIIDNKSFNILSNELMGHFYKLEKYKYLYAFSSLIICTYIGEFLNHLIKKLKNYRESKRVQH